MNAVTPGGGESVTSVTLEQEKYFAALVAATPMGKQCYYAESLTSLDSPWLSQQQQHPMDVASINLPVLGDATPIAGWRRSPMAAVLSYSFRGFSAGDRATCM